MPPRPAHRSPPAWLRAAALAAVLACALCGCLRQDRPAPLARDGVLDLSAWDFGRDGPVRLDGLWEVRWERLAAPADFAAPGAGPAELCPVPGPWTKTRPDAGWFSATGTASMRLRVLLPPGAGPLALRLTGAGAAVTLWADGEVAARSGVPALAAADETPDLTLQWVPLREGAVRESDAGGPLELVLQLSNHSFREGGVHSSLWLGDKASMQERARVEAAIAAFLAGTLFIMSAYHVALYFFRRSNVSPLLFAAYCFVWLANYVSTDSSGWLARSVLPGLPPLGLERFGLAALCCSLPVGYAFLRSLYPQEFPRGMALAVCALALGFTSLAALAPFLVLSRALPGLYLVTMGLILHCFARLFRAWRLRRDGASFTFAGFLALGLVGFNDMLSDMRLLDTPLLLAPGMLFFILSQAFALSQRLSHAFSAVETLSLALEQRNERMAAEMAERRRLERQIVSISEEERRRMGISLHDGLCQQLTAARLRCAALDGLAPEKRSEEMGKLSLLLDDMVDHAYELSRGLWPLEHGPLGSGPSLADMIRNISRSSRTPITFTQERGCDVCRSANATQLFRIAQEALANALKHARPSEIRVRFSCAAGGEAVLSVVDDGVGRAGAKASKGGLGLGIMAHRAHTIGGELLVEDEPGGGTRVSCRAACECTDPGCRDKKAGGT